MYNYSLLNNAIRLLLISHSTTTQQQDKHPHIRRHSFAVYDVGLSCQFVILKGGCIIKMHMLSSPERGESNKEVK